jgi:hypothetical protein
MAIFRACAKVLEPDDPSVWVYEAGLRPCSGQPGLLLGDILQRTGGIYRTTTPLTPQLRDDIREVAQLTSDAELLAIAHLTEVPVSLEHLRGLDPEARIVIRVSLEYEGDEGAHVRKATGRGPALATILPDGSVVASDPFSEPQS